ncbi:autotransporter outer membrane beta-barrel domain-containing protein [Dongia deserti]|uniref:autotransporter outer membrane beta-barrel domain-containing protein n=1 Tax=Dongia deserti TaxID=2268030 RepID=UPI0013C4DC76|nr:autotransporter outer membrane beta-barrel domain-containing protein [Dongia deserti]
MNRRARRAARASGKAAYRFETHAVPPKVRSALLLGASGLAVAIALATGDPARALDECGAPAGVPPSVTCNNDGVPATDANPYPGGIQYQVIDLTVVVVDGAIIDTTGAAGEPGGVISGGDGNYGDLVIKAGTSGGAGITISTDDDNAEGIYARSNDGSVAIASTGDISTDGEDSTGIYAYAKGAGASATVTSNGDITTQGNDSDGIFARSDTGGVKISSTGDITTGGTDADGIFGRGYSSTTIYSTGNVTATGALAGGIAGTALAGQIVLVSEGDISTDGPLAPGIAAFGISGATITSTGDITAKGNSSGGIAGSALGGIVTISSTGAVSTLGDNATGILGSALAGTVIISSSGDVSTNGDNASGIRASGLDGAGITSNGNISTKGDGADGINAYSKDADVAVTSSGEISTQGMDAAGIEGRSAGGAVTIASTGGIVTKGGGADGISAEADTFVLVISSGDITTGGNGARAIDADAGTGSASVYSSGDIKTNGGGADGIAATSIGSFVTVASNGEISVEGGGVAGIHAYAFTGHSTVASAGDITAKGGGATGIHAESYNSFVTVTSDGNIAAQGGSATGIYAYAAGAAAASKVTSIGNIAVTGGGPAGIHTKSASGSAIIYSTGNIAITGASGFGLYAGGALSGGIVSKGDVMTKGNGTVALFATASAGTAGVYSEGSVTTSGSGALGIYAQAPGEVLILSAGDISTSGDLAQGIFAKSTAALSKIVSVGDVTTDGDGAIGIHSYGSTYAVIYSTGAVSTSGNAAVGLLANGPGISIVLSEGNVSTIGSSAHGIHASGNLLTGAQSTGDISVAGDGASGIISTSGGDKSIVVSSGNISTTGDGTFGILVNGATTAQAVSQGNISVTGDAATGIFATGAGGDVLLVQSGNILAPGDGSDGVFVVAAAGAATVIVQGDIMGGGGTGQGIFVSALNASTLGIGGSVGALSDFAIRGDIEDLAITNVGTITGFFDLGAGADVLANMSPTSINLRHFADTDGDGVRDTEGVAIGDFGAGSDTVENIGTLRLSSVSGATSWNTTGQIMHPGGGNADITQEGVEQGFLTNLEFFVHSGLITLQDGVAGDLLVITDQTDGAAAGNNVFTSNGGRLALDVVLDDGSSGQSDVLILDNAVTGTGATAISIINAGGSGGQTTGDGILVVNVRTASDADAFAPAGPAVAGAYQYDLFFQNQAKTDQNWYLRSSFFDGALEYPAIATGALLTWYSDLGVLHERLGGVRRATEAGQAATLPLVTTAAGDTSTARMNDSGQAGWLRVIGADMDVEQHGPADFDLDTVRAEAGFDIGFDNVLSDDWLVLGAFAGYGWASVGFEQSSADIDFDIATIGAYATYFRGPYYLDALVKFDWLDGDYNSENVSEDGDVEIPVIGLSLETGYRFDLTEGGLYLQPQAQLVYAHAGGDSFTDDSGAEIKLEDADSLRGRLGLRIGQELSTTAGARAEPVKGNFYFEASVNQEFLGETDARVSGRIIEQELPDTTFEVGAGFDIALPKDGVSFTIDADYIFGDDAEGVAATGGIRISW